jgi:hypothetical protein
MTTNVVEGAVENNVVEGAVEPGGWFEDRNQHSNIISSNIFESSNLEIQKNKKREIFFSDPTGGTGGRLGNPRCARY